MKWFLVKSQKKIPKVDNLDFVRHSALDNDRFGPHFVFVDLDLDLDFDLLLPIPLPPRVGFFLRGDVLGDGLGDDCTGNITGRDCCSRRRVS